jgi:hypothetical protein
MEKINWTDHLRNEGELHRDKEDQNVLGTIKRKRANWIGHILRTNCFSKNIIEGKIGETSDGKTRKKT